jgi:hypothetical protein
MTKQPLLQRMEGWGLSLHGNNGSDSSMAEGA